MPKIEEGYDVVARSEFWGREAGAYDLVVFVEADERRGVGADPGLDIGRVLVEVARVTNPGGRLIFHNAQRGGVAEALAEKRSVRGTVRRSWEQAKAEGLPPFGREVRVEMTGPKPPRPGWQLRTHGPKKVESGWELLIRCRDEDLEDVREWIQAERRDRRRRLRVEVF